MSDHKMAQSQKHTHRQGCGHATIGHDDHRDYVDHGRMDHVTAGRVEPHFIRVDTTNPAACTPGHACGAHAANHVHGPACEHTAVPHGDHIDYVVDGHLHHPCDKHCDDHGPVDLHL